MELAVLKQRVGQRLGIVPAAIPLASEDAEVILSAYTDLLAELYEHELAAWNVTDDVPDQYADILIGMTAARLVDDFKIPEPRRSGLIMQSAFGMASPTPDERRLRRMMAIESFGDVVTPDYY